MIETWSEVTLDSLQNLWGGFVSFLPEMVGALVVFIVGWFVAVWIGKLITEILKRLRLDEIFKQAKWEEALEAAELEPHASRFVGAIVKWVLVIVFLLAAVQILGLTSFASFLENIVSWLPNLIVAVAIFIVAAIIADLCEKIAKAVVGKLGVGYVNVLGVIIRWAVWIFAILAILSQLGIAKEIVHILVSGFVALIVISTSLAFGLGGKDLAKDVLEDVREKIRE